MSRERWMSLLFATGSLCFLVGPFPGYAQLVGATADAGHDHLRTLDRRLRRTDLNTNGARLVLGGD